MQTKSLPESSLNSGWHRRGLAGNPRQPHQCLPAAGTPVWAVCKNTPRPSLTENRSTPNFPIQQNRTRSASTPIPRRYRVALPCADRRPNVRTLCNIRTHGSTFRLRAVARPGRARCTEAGGTCGHSRSITPAVSGVPSAQHGDTGQTRIFLKHEYFAGKKAINI